MIDEINDLMERCVTAMRRVSEYEDFLTLYTERTRREPGEWYVGFYWREHGKMGATGPTLREALLAWLDAYEDWVGG